MVFPPTYRKYEFGDRCTAIDVDLTCDKDFNCGTCSLAWETYKKELEDEDYRDFVVPSGDCSQNGIIAFRNEPYIIVKVNNIEDLFKRFALEGVPFKSIENAVMDSDDMLLTYPYWYALKTLEGLGDPLSYRGGKDIPLIAEYSDCVYMVAPVIEEE